MPVTGPAAAPAAAPAPRLTASRASLASRTSRGSRGSRSSRGTAAQFDYGLSPGLQQLIARLVDTKDVGLIAYLSAIPGEPHGATKPPTAVAKLQQRGSVRLRSIMKISKPQVRFEPTYRLEPLRPFRAERARALVQAALETAMDGATYSDQWATDACRILAAYITQCVKALDTYAPCRYKIGTQVSVMERNWQGVRTELGVLWDEDRDRYITASVETTTMVAFAVVYAVYWD
ncbi:Tctex1 domain-containing protein 1 [Frankliniella fusca]|uniref:Tctex1 domain-containing protein 1 n=1 Tax=Frankliniella fusca TaxID=407009 RepID=A0AAE1H3G6_9NEOP|nr:Tctex1 domain-containing protein 1 [Frankliniella fusca]